MDSRNSNAPWRFLLGGLFGIMSALFALHVLYTTQQRSTSDLIQRWRAGESIDHDVTAVVGFFVAGILATEYLALRDRYRMQVTLAQALREDNARKNKLLSIAAHELQSPVAAFRWGTDTLLERGLGPITAPQEQHLHGMQEQLTALQKITRDLLDITKLELDTLVMALRPIRSGDLMRIIGEAARATQPIADAKRITLTVSTTAADALPVQADTMRIARVAEILTENAVRYTPEHGKVTITCSTDGNVFRIAVADTGIGIPAAEQAQVFTQFFRGERARTLQPSGSGVGLYLAKQYLNRHGGTITCVSTEGSGSTFTFTLPIRTHLPTELEEMLGRI